MPLSKPKKRVGAHQAKKRGVRPEFGAQTEQRVDGVVGSARGFGRIGQRDGEAGFIGYGETCQLNAVFEAGRRSIHFERLRADWSEKNGIKIEGLTGSARHGQVTQMRRVKAAAKKGD